MSPKRTGKGDHAGVPGRVIIPRLGWQVKLQDFAREMQLGIVQARTISRAAPQCYDSDRA